MLDCAAYLGSYLCPGQNECKSGSISYVHWVGCGFFEARSGSLAACPSEKEQYDN
jgi:hypothetical protein